MNRRASALCKLLGATCLSSMAFASAALAQAVAIPTAFKNLDANGVDLTDGSFYLSIPVGSIGTGDGLMQLEEYADGAQGHSLQIFFQRSVTSGVATITITHGSSSEAFTGASTASSFTPAQGNGATLTRVSAQAYTYTSADGTKINFGWPAGEVYQHGTTAYCATGSENAACDLLAKTVTYPSGKTLTYNWRAGQNCTIAAGGDGENFNCAQFYRLSSVTSSYGYRVTFSYLNNTDPTSGTAPPTWRTRTGVTLQNLGDGTLLSATYNFASEVTLNSLTDVAGRTWTLGHDSNLFVNSIQRPGDASAAETIARTGSNLTSVSIGGVTTNYSRVLSGATSTMTVTDGLSHQTVVVSNMTTYRPTSVKNGLNFTTYFQYDGSSHLTRIIYPELNYVQYTYDVRGNVTQTLIVAKSSSGLPNITTSAVYPTACSNVVICNKPTSTTDANGNVTSYTYDPTHGGVLTVTQPAVGGIAPQARYTYTQMQAYYNPGSGSVVASGAPTYVLTGISTCRTTSSCTGGADEVKTSIGYGPQTAGTANNLLPVSSSGGAGDGSLTATSSVAYDGIGNIYTRTDQLGNVTRYRYDSDRELVGVVGPDPDGSGALKNRAQRLTYNGNGLVTLAEQGTVPSQSDTDWASFVTLQQVATSYDTAYRKVQDSTQAGSTTYAVVQYGYDAVGNLQCTAQRMNSTVFGSLPSSACTLGTTGSYGPDRITYNSYDAANELVKVTSAYGVSGSQRDDATYTYSNNGKIGSMADAKGNLTPSVPTPMRH